MPQSLFNKVAGLRPANLLKKETLVQVFSCEFCEIFKKNFFTEQMLAIAYRRFLVLGISFSKTKKAFPKLLSKKSLKLH